MSEGRPTTTTELSPLRREQQRRARRAEERRWRALAGPVTRSYMNCPNCGEPHDRRQPCVGDDPSVEAELGEMPAHGAGGTCPECAEPSVNGGRCWTCRGRSMQEAGA